MGSSASSPNEHLYSSLYGREMELMRKMFKANEKMDPLNDGNGSFAGSLRSSNGNGSNFGPYTSPIFGGNASKYFEGLNTNEQATKFAGGLRSDLFEHNVHNSNIGLTPAIKSQASLLSEKHFGMQFATNHNNNNVMNPNQNFSDSNLSCSNNNNNNNNNIVLHNLKSMGGGFATANLSSPTSPSSTSATNNHPQNLSGGHLDGPSMHFEGVHAGSFHGSPGNLDKSLISNKMVDFESSRKTSDDVSKSLSKMGAKLDEHFLDDQLKSRLSQQLAASLLNSPHHHQSPGSHHNNHGSNGNSNNNNNNNLSNDDEDDDEFTSL